MKTTELPQSNTQSRLTQAQTLKIEEITALFPDSERPLVVSIHLPMEKAGPETRKNPIVFKNAISKAESLLQRRDSNAGKELSRQLKELEANAEETHPFWQHQSRGLSLFLSAESEPSLFSLPFAPSEQVSVDSVPDVLPLVRAKREKHYLILALNHGQVGLYEAASGQIEEIKLDGIPTTLEEAMKYDDPEESIQFRSASSATEGGSHPASAAYHGHGVTGDEEKDRKIQRFYEMVNHGISAHFPNQEIPLLLLGAPETTGLFAKMCSYPHLSNTPIEHHYDGNNTEEMKKSIHEHLEGLRKDARAESVAKVEQATASNLGSTKPGEIVKASIEGRVETLWVDSSASLVGNYDDKSHRVEIAEDAPGRSLLLELVRNVLLNGGEVEVVTEEGILPNAGELAATFRY